MLRKQKKTTEKVGFDCSKYPFFCTTPPTHSHVPSNFNQLMIHTHTDTRDFGVFQTTGLRMLYGLSNE